MRSLIPSVLCLLALAAPAAGEELPLGGDAAGRVEPGQPVVYRCGAAAGGVLGLALAGDVERDLYLVVRSGERLLGVWDDTVLGQPGVERAAVPLAEAGELTVEVHARAAGSYRLSSAWLTQPAGAPAELGGVLPLGAAGRGEAPGRLAFEAEEAGLLVVLAAAEDDVYLLLRGPGGDTLARADRDFAGDPGLEPAAFVIPRAGTYTLQVAPYGEGCPLVVAAAWRPQPDLAEAADADGPSRAEALALEPGQPVNGRLDPPAGDRWDYYAITPSRGRLRVESSGVGDLCLFLYAEGEEEWRAWSDEDHDGEPGQERIDVPVEPGVTYYLKVEATVGEAQSYALRLR